jgi:hypothetical protein
VDRRELLFWTISAAGLGLVRYLMIRGQYQTGGLAARAAAAAAVGDLAGVAIPQLQHPAMLLAAHEAQKAAKHFYHRVPYAQVRRPRPQSRPASTPQIKDAEFEIIEDKKDEKDT